MHHHLLAEPHFSIPQGNAAEVQVIILHVDLEENQRLDQQMNESCVEKVEDLKIFRCGLRYDHISQNENNGKMVMQTMQNSSPIW